jgi:membrane protein YqaA with SNARE-associated domain
MFRKLYDWTFRLAGHRHAMRWLALISFAESSFFPIPPDVIVIPMVLARRDRAWTIAAVVTISSVLGGMAGYAIGYFLWDSVGRPLADLYGMTARVEALRATFNEYGAWFILAKGLTPIPFKLVTIASGLAHFNFGLFVLCAAVTRAARFFLIAGLLKQFGEPMQAFIERRLALVGWAFLALVAGGIALVFLL